MKITQKAKKNLFIIFITCILIVSILLCVIIYQTVKVNNLKNEINSTHQQSIEAQEQIKRQQEEIAYYESDEFKNDYLKYELEQLEDGELIYK